jgi:DNA-binding winged helix-turn-helix (wHTH) protein
VSAISSPDIVNPYYVGGPIRDPSNFYGRSQQLRCICERIGKRECTSIVGERRSGKTSLLLNILDRNVQERYLSGDRESIYIYLDADVVCRDQEGFFRDIFSQVKTHCPNLPFSPDDDLIDNRRVRRLLETLFPRRLVLLIDNFECITRCPDLSPDFFSFLRALTGKSYEVSFVVATCERLIDCFGVIDAKISPFANLFTPVEVGAFTSQELQDFILCTSMPSKAPLWEIRDDIVHMAGYHPYLVQMACWHYFERWSERGTLDASVTSLVHRSFEEDARPHFQSIWNRYLSDEERKALTALAQGKEPSQPNVLWRLERKGYVDGGRIISGVFANFMLQQQPNARSSSKGVRIDPDSSSVFLDDELISPPLTKTEFKLLALLWQNKGKVCDRYAIIKHVYSEDLVLDTSNYRVDQLVSRLRSRIEPQGKPWHYIVNVHGWGWKLMDGASDDELKNSMKSRSGIVR